MTQPDYPSPLKKIPTALKVVLVLLAINLVYGTVLLVQSWRAPKAPPQGPANATGTGTPSNVSDPTVDIGIAYGTEKQRWLQWCVGEFSKMREGAGIRVNLIPLGSLEGAQAILREDKRINVWSPASSLYREQFQHDWNTRFGSKPIAREERLALSPMVFVTWKERHEAFVKKYGHVSFQTIAEGLQEPGGWASIAGKSEWGVFKFGHTHPGQSNSGLAALVIMAYDYHNKTSNLAMGDVLDAGFQKQMGIVETGVSGMTNSTGKMMNDMVLFGPSTFDCLFVYESVVIDYLENAAGRWGKLQVVYPQHNIWNDNPYYVLDVPWSTQSNAPLPRRFWRSSCPSRRNSRHSSTASVPVTPPSRPTLPIRRL